MSVELHDCKYEPPLVTSDPKISEVAGQILEEKTVFTGSKGDWFLVDLATVPPVPCVWDPAVRMTHYKPDLYSEGVGEVDIADSNSMLPPEDYTASGSSFLVPMGESNYRVMDRFEARIRTYRDRARLVDPSVEVPPDFTRSLEVSLIREYDADNRRGPNADTDQD